MNTVNLIGRLTKDPEVRYSTGANQTAVARFTLAVDRERQEDEADFISCVTFGKSAENMEKYMSKGRKVAVIGRIQTGSYEKDGKKYYTTDVICNRVEFLDKKTDAPKNNGEENQVPAGNYGEESQVSMTPEGFEKLTDDDIPFD